MTQFTSLDELRESVDLLSKDSLSSLMDWLVVRFRFEGADIGHWFLPDVGPFIKLSLMFYFPPQIVPDEKEISSRVNQFLFQLEDPNCDAYIIVSPYLLCVTIFWKNA